MPSPLLDELRSVTQGVAVLWLGNIGWLLSDGERVVATDLDLMRDSRLQPSPIPPEDIAPVLDIHFLTHEHEDHFATPTCRVLAEKGECLFVVPANCERKARGLGLPGDRIRVARPGQPFEARGVGVEPLRALHGHHHGIVYGGANLEDCGYALSLGGKRLLQPGDTLLLDEHRELEGIDVLFVSPTEHNMHVGHAALLIEALQPDVVLPQHFGTYAETAGNRYWTHGYPEELVARLSEPMRQRFRTLAQGEVLYLT